MVFQWPNREFIKKICVNPTMGCVCNSLKLSTSNHKFLLNIPGNMKIQSWCSRRHPPLCRPLFFLVMAAVGCHKKSCFKSAENRAASSLWVVDHRYKRILRASKLLWEYSVLKLRNLVLRKKTPFRKRLEALTYIKNYFDTIKYLTIEIHLNNFNNWDQNSYVRGTIWCSIQPYKENVRSPFTFQNENIMYAHLHTISFEPML